MDEAVVGGVRVIYTTALTIFVLSVSLKINPLLLSLSISRTVLKQIPVVADLLFPPSTTPRGYTRRFLPILGTAIAIQPARAAVSPPLPARPPPPPKLFAAARQLQHANYPAMELDKADMSASKASKPRVVGGRRWWRHLRASLP
jgi:hypothetical protein